VTIDPSQASPIPLLEELGVLITSEIPEGPPDAISGLLPEKGQLVIAGETNVGKSLVALEICSALTSERPLWQELTPNIKAKKILYVLGEHYREIIQRMHRKTELPLGEVWIIGPNELKFDKWMVQNGKQNPTIIRKFEKWATGCDLIIFDPLSAFVTGIDSENDNLQMRLVIDSMSLIAQSVGASCLILAHQGKPYMDKLGVEHHRKSYAIRGASGIEDAATNIFYMNEYHGAEKPVAAEKESLSSLVDIDEDGKIYELVCRKYKGEAPERYRLLRDPQTLTHRLLGNRPQVELKRLVVKSKVDRILKAFPNMPVMEAYQVIASVVGCDVRTIQRYLAED
jgi:hypothetical protein